MHNIKWIREHPEEFDAGLKKRGIPAEVASAEQILLGDKEKRALQNELQRLQQASNQLAKEIGALKSKGEDATAQLEESKQLKARLQEAEAALKALPTLEGEGADFLAETLASLPNLPAPEVPFGKDENDNVELRRWGTPPTFSFPPKQHFDLGEALGLMNFEQTAKLSGSRFVTLHGPLARLERALAAFMLDMHTREFGYTEVSPPLLVREDALFGTGQLPKFKEDMFLVAKSIPASAEGPSRLEHTHYLISTAEISLTNLVREQILEEEQLPLRFTALTPCFRSEAGAAGKDTRGMLRQHQFYKVELVSITTPEASEEEHERMTSIAETVLQRLGLPYRVMLLCSQDRRYR